MSVRILLFKEDMTEIYFVNYYQSKNHKQRYKTKKLLYKTIWQCPIKTARRDLRSSLHFLILWVRWEWIILIIEIAHFILFLFSNKHEKKHLWHTYSYSWTSLPSPFPVHTTWWHEILKYLRTMKNPLCNASNLDVMVWFFVDVTTWKFIKEHQLKNFLLWVIGFYIKAGIVNYSKAAVEC